MLLLVRVREARSSADVQASGARCRRRASRWCCFALRVVATTTSGGGGGGVPNPSEGEVLLASAGRGGPLCARKKGSGAHEMSEGCGTHAARVETRPPKLRRPPLAHAPRAGFCDEGTKSALRSSKVETEILGIFTTVQEYR